MEGTHFIILPITSNNPLDIIARGYNLSYYNESGSTRVDNYYSSNASKVLFCWLKSPTSSSEVYPNYSGLTVGLSNSQIIYSASSDGWYSETSLPNEYTYHGVVFHYSNPRWEPNGRNLYLNVGDTYVFNNIDEAKPYIYNDIESKYPITYRPINCSFPSAPTEAMVGDTVVVSVVFSDGYGLVDESNIYVTNNGVVIPSTYSNGQLTFTMPDPS